MSAAALLLPSKAAAESNALPVLMGCAGFAGLGLCLLHLATVALR